MNIDHDDDDLFGDEAFSSFQQIDVTYATKIGLFLEAMLRI